MLFFCSVAMARLVKTCQETAEKWVLFGWMVFLRSQTCVCVCAVNTSFTFPVSTLLSISAVFECCEFVTMLLVLAWQNITVGGASWKLHSLEYAGVQKLCGHFVWTSSLQNTVSMKIYWICNVQTDLKIDLIICFFVCCSSPKYSVPKM